MRGEGTRLRGLRAGEVRRVKDGDEARDWNGKNAESRGIANSEGEEWTTHCEGADNV